MTDYVYLQGKTKWFRPEKANEWGKWSHVLYPNPDSLAKFKELQEGTEEVQGIKTHLSKDEDGYYVTLSRPSSKVIKGKIVTFEQPMVLQADGRTPLKGVFVGNGSEVTSKISVYTHFVPGGKKKAKAIRWETTRVDNLIPYEPKRDLNLEQQVQIEGIDKVPPEYF